MKKLVIFIFLLALFGSCSKKGCTDPISYNYDSSAGKDDGSCLISVPDDNFELYLETHTSDRDSVNVGDITSMGDGIVNNNLVLLDRIKNVDSLTLRYQSDWNSIGIGINDITGIEGFKNLEYIDCANNQISSIDVQSNLYLEYLNVTDCDLSNLDLSNNSALRQLDCGYNKLNTLNLSKNVNLEILGCLYNPLSSLDLTSNINLTGLNSQDCPNLNSIDLRNGANNLINVMWLSSTPNLSCIAVDDSTWSNNNWTGPAFWVNLSLFHHACP